jgi:site-specific DNA recombinase
LPLRAIALGSERGGRPFDKGTQYKLLTNRTYAGTVHHGGQHYPGEHAAIVERAVFEKVQAILARNGGTRGAAVKNKYGALLKGLLFCHGCRCGMTHTYSAKAGGGKRYRYYVCVSAQKRGWDTCTSKSVPAGQIERFVVDQLRRVGKDPAVLDATLRQVRQQGQKDLAEAAGDLKAAEWDLARQHAALRKVAATGSPEELVALHERIRTAEQRVSTAKATVERLKGESVTPGELADALAAFEPVWEQLSPKEQARVVRLLVARVEYDGGGGSVAITFRQSGIKSLAADGIDADEVSR